MVTTETTAERVPMSGKGTVMGIRKSGVHGKVTGDDQCSRNEGLAVRDAQTHVMLLPMVTMV